LNGLGLIVPGVSVGEYNIVLLIKILFNKINKIESINVWKCTDRNKTPQESALRTTHPALG